MTEKLKPKQNKRVFIKAEIEWNFPAENYHHKNVILIIHKYSRFN